MGKSGGSQAGPGPWQDPSSEMGGIEDIMGAYIASQSGILEQLAKNQQPAPQMPQFPSIATSPDIDWAEQSAKLAAKTKADEAIASKQRRGRASTIATSPLLDDEDAKTTLSVLER